MGANHEQQQLRVGIIPTLLGKIRIRPRLEGLQVMARRYEMFCSLFPTQHDTIGSIQVGRFERDLLGMASFIVNVHSAQANMHSKAFRQKVGIYNRTESRIPGPNSIIDPQNQRKRSVLSPTYSHRTCQEETSRIRHCSTASPQ